MPEQTMDTFILLASDRKSVAESEFTRFPLFSDYNQPAYFPWFLSLEDITIKSEGNYTLSAKEPTSFLVIPLAGGVELTGLNQYETYLDAGEWGRFDISSEETVRLSNSFPQSINLLLIACRPPDMRQAAFKKGRLRPDNSLVPLPVKAPISVTVGLFGERESITRSVPKPGLIAYVLDGIFEVHDRLLYNRDGISLPEAKLIDFECFTSNGLLLLISEL